MPIELEMANHRVVGSLERITGKGIVDFRVGRLRAVDRIGLWLRHLVLAAAAEKETEAVFVAEDELFSLSPVTAEQARSLLAELLGIYDQGLREPLPFFPETSWARANDQKDWKKCWDGDFNRSGESEDAAIQIAFRNVDPLAEPFESLARKIWGPVIARCAEEE